MRPDITLEFVRLRPGVVVRSGFEPEVDGWIDAGLAEAVPVAAGGRGGSRALALRDGGRAWVRRYRHGGILGALLGDVYWQRPPRSWRELAVTEAARRAGLLVPEGLAAAAVPIASAGCVLHRCLLVTRELPGRRSLAAALRAAPSASERDAWIEHAWQAIERLHAAGIHHPDLNSSNLLVSDLAESVAVIDFDRASAGERPVGAIGRALARRRFARSIAKLALPGLDRRGVRRLLARNRAGRRP
jgi:3-deoxy-D-manno-octulosonic acid kinase